MSKQNFSTNQEFTQEEQTLIRKLQEFGEDVKPAKGSFEKMLTSLSKEAVTIYEFPRYSFSMWKYALVALVIVLIGGFAYLKHGQINPSNQTSQVTQDQEVPNQALTTDNTDATLQQTDQAIQSNMSQADQDLSTFDQANSSEEDVNNI